MKPDFVYQKNADKTLNRIMIPKAFIKQHGNKFYMEVYKDQIIIKPIKEGE